MTQPQKNTLRVIAIVSGLLSLPLTWMTLSGATMQGPFGQSFGSPFGGMTINVTGLNGSITFLVKTPIWLIVGVAIVANALQLMRNTKVFAVPPAAEWGTAVVAVGWAIIANLLAIGAAKATLGIGALLGLACAGGALVCLVIKSPPEVKSSDPETDIPDPQP
jgi:hypothetical protein